MRCGSQFEMAVVACVVVGTMGSAFAQTTTRASVSSAGVQGNQQSTNCSLSTDGRFVAFESLATNLVPGPYYSDIYVRDRLLGTTEIISVDSTGGHPGPFGMFSTVGASISGDGRFVAFQTAMPLIPGDTNQAQDVFVRDRLLGTTEGVSYPVGGPQPLATGLIPSISSDGRYVAFQNSTPPIGNQIYVRDRLLATTSMVSVDSTGAPGSASSEWPSISTDGRFVVFRSDATNLVPGDTNGLQDVFLRDTQAGTTERIDVDFSGNQLTNTSVGNHYSVSSDGRFVAFDSVASNIVPNDTNNRADVFVRDRQAGSTARVSTDSYGLEGDGTSSDASMSSDGNRIVFFSDATNLVLNDTNIGPDVFLHEISSGRTIRISVGSGGTQSNYYYGGSECSIAADGSAIGLSSNASNFVQGDTNNCIDIFIHEPDLCPPALKYCAAKVNSLGCLPTIDSIGVPSTTAGSGFAVTCTNIRNNKPGLLFYSITGRLNAPFQGGTLCVASPIKRAPAQSAGGSPAPTIDCSGNYSTDFNAFAVGSLGGSPLFDLQIPGTKVNCQWWGRDPGFPHPLDTMLSEGLEFFMCP